MTEATTNGRTLVEKTGVLFGHWLHYHYPQERKAINRHFYEYTLAP